MGSTPNSWAVAGAWTVSSPSGYGNLSDVFALFNTSASGQNACYIRYNVASNLLYVASPWQDIGWSGGLVPHTSGTASNPQCTIDAGQSSVQPSGNQLTLTVYITFQPSFAGTWNNYVLVQDNAGLNSEWQQIGTWTVPPPPADFTLNVTPGTATIPMAGIPATYTVNIGAINGFAGTVTLSVSGLPGGASGSFSPATITGSGSSSLSITSTAGVAGNFPLTIIAASGNLLHSVGAMLVIQDFVFTVSPSLQMVSSGQSATYTALVTPLNGFNQSLLFGGYSPTPCVPGFGPTQMLAPGSISPNSPTAFSLGPIYLTPPASSLFVCNNICVGGHCAQATIAINQSPDFSISVSSAQTVTPPANPAYTVIVTPAGGLQGTLTLSVTGLPPGVGYKVSPPGPYVNGSPTQAGVFLTIPAGTAPGTYNATITATITGVSGTTTHRAALSLVTAEYTTGQTVTPVDGSTSLTVDGTAYLSAQTFQWQAGTNHILSSPGSTGTTLQRYTFSSGGALTAAALPTDPEAPAGGGCPWQCHGGACSGPLPPPAPSPAPVISGISGTIQPGVPSTISISGSNFGTVAGYVQWCAVGANPCIQPLDTLPSTEQIISWSDNFIQVTVTLAPTTSETALNLFVISVAWISGYDYQNPSRGAVLTVNSRSCVPAVSSIQVDGASTNVIIAGTSGYMLINGQCFTGATAVGLPPGITVSAFAINSDAQISATFASSASAPTGQSDVTVTGSGGTSSQNVPALVVAISLRSFWFTNSRYYYRDCAGDTLPIPIPTWPAPTVTTGGGQIPCPQQGAYGDHAYYAAGDSMRGTVLLAITPTLQQAVTGAYIQGTTGAAGTFSASNVTIPAGQTSFQINVSDSTALPSSQTQFYNPLMVAWSVGQAGTSCSAGNCAVIGASTNPLYVTLQAPLSMPDGGSVMLTYLALAVGQGGATDQLGTFQKTWAQFSTGSGPANIQTWDGRPLQYYPSGVAFNGCATTASQVVQGNGAGQCGSFMLLLADALALNGIQTTLIKTNTKTAQQSFMVKNWSTTVPPYSPFPGYQWELFLGGDWNGQVFAGMVPTGSTFGDLSNGTGLPGQNSPNPSEKIFGAHFFLKIPTSVAPPGQGPYFDPSYGVWYADQTDFEGKAVAYYALWEANQTDNQGNALYSIYGVRSPSGQTNMCFAEWTGSSYGPCN